MTGRVSHFFDTPEEYTRKWGVKPAYVEQAAHYVAANTTASFEEAVEIVKKKVSPSQPNGFIDPRVRILKRGKNGDRTLVETTFDDMMQEAEREEHVMSPSMVFYTSPNKRRSLLSLYTATLVNKRSVIKKKQQAAKQAKDGVMENFHKQGQTSVKIAVNSISGATCSPHNAFYNPSAHTSLTSTCRVTTAYANTNNERLISGNRHYWNPYIVINNIASISTIIDLDAVMKCVNEFNLAIPNVDQVMDCVMYSAKNYWNAPAWIPRIRHYVEGLTDAERCAFVYNGDLHQLGKLNPEFWSGFLTKLISDPDISLGNNPDIIKRMDGDLQSLIGILRKDVLTGKDWKDVPKDNPEGWKFVLATIQHVLNTFDEYETLIAGFWRTDCPPPSVANMPNMLRRAVLGGDTDSSMATAEEWVHWYTGKYVFDDVAAKVSAVIIYLSSMTLVHILAQFSSNVGVAKSQQYQIAMKNEFMYSAYIRTTVAKHYFSNTIACEGNVYAEEDLDIKGVQLHAGKAPQYIRAQIKDFQVRMLETVAQGGLIDAVKELKAFGDTERKVLQSLQDGSSDFLTTMEIKDKKSYSSPYTQPYLYSELWDDVFAPKYGAGGELPYYAVKINMNLPNKTALGKAIDTMADRELAERFRTFVQKHGKKDFTYMVVPYDLAKDHGIPQEIIDMADVRGVIKETLSSAYLSLESFGLYYINGNLTKLISDYQ